MTVVLPHVFGTDPPSPPVPLQNLDDNFNAIVALLNPALTKLATFAVGGFAIVGSATTTNIGATGVGYVQITGTTTITAFDNVTAGTIIFVEFAGILTLTQNITSLILPNAANIVTGAGDTAIFVSEGSGNWRCLSYNRAKSFFASTAQTITAAGQLVIAHGLGQIPDYIVVELRNVTPEANYTAGQQVQIAPGPMGTSASNLGLSLIKDVTNLTLRFGSGAAVFHLPDATTGADTALTPANWTVVVKAGLFPGH